MKWASLEHVERRDGPADKATLERQGRLDLKERLDSPDQLVILEYRDKMEVKVVQVQVENVEETALLETRVSEVTQVRLA